MGDRHPVHWAHDVAAELALGSPRASTGPEPSSTWRHALGVAGRWPIWGRWPTGSCSWSRGGSRPWASSPECWPGSPRRPGGLAGGCGCWARGRDRGSQYTSIRYTERLAEAGIAPSVGSVGDSYDNALAETTIGLYKTELIERHRPWRTPEQVELATLEWIDWFNNRRLHGSIGDVPPAEAEGRYYANEETAQVVEIQ
jgi:hypothetical protein